jgi:hypothetical protein
MSGPERFVLNAQQERRLLSARAAWEEDEGEERLERLRQREEDAETLRLIVDLLVTSDFSHTRDLTRPQLIHLLTLFRALAPNPNLDARLLGRPGEPETFNRDLWDLLYGPASGPLRLRQFLARRHAGGQTALQLLCGVYPERWPIVTRTGLRSLDITAEQQRLAVQLARDQFDLPLGSEGDAPSPGGLIEAPGLSDTDPILRLLAEVVIYDAVRAVMEAADYVEVHRLLTGTATRVTRHRRALMVRPVPATQASATSPSLPTHTSFESAFGSYESNELNRLGASRVGEPERADYVAAALPDLDGLRTADLLATIEAEIAAQGFTYPPLVLRDYYLCLQSKPYVWLLGANGIGKTRLTSLFAAALTGNRADQYRLIPVRPDWGDSAALLGYVNLLAGHGEGRYVGTPFLDFLLRAAAPANADRAYFLCLDEMNLARVEHYFAEVLSAMETPARELLLPNGSVLTLPPNLFITGTLNTDEATHMLSRKVLDRANTVSLRAVSLKALPTASAPDTQVFAPAVRQALFLRRRVTTVNAARVRLAAVAETDLADWVVDRLVEVNALLEPFDLQFAYRVRDEALCYCANSFDMDGGGLLAPEADANIALALDFQLLQKVLPRLGGTQDQLEPVLNDLHRWAERNRLLRTAQKLRQLLSRLRRDGFVSFD